MKKVLVIFLALIIGLSMSAQIQNKPLGFTLGETTKSEVYNKYKNEPLFLEDETGLIGVGGLQFAGQTWDIVTFEFYNNRLFAVQFFLTEPQTSRQLMDVLWDNFQLNLLEKYGEYYYDNSKPDFKLYSDGKTDLSLSYQYLSGNKGLSLRYCDRTMAEQKNKDGIDDL